MSRFTFKSKSGLVHVYDYVDIAKTSIFFTIDADGNVVNQIPVNCGTLASHIKRVTLDFNANSDVLPDDKFDNSPHVDLGMWTGSTCCNPHDDEHNGFALNPTMTGEDFIRNAINSLKKCSTFLMALWRESKTAFFISVVTASIALMMLIPALMLAIPVVLAVAVTSLVTKN
jgi:hypothetical protein